MEKLIQEISEHITPTYNRFPVVLDHGNGVLVYDVDGKEYIDFGAGIAVNSLGHNNEELQQVILDQLKKIQHISNLYYSVPVKEAAEILSEKTGMDEVFFVNSGAEAVECALKLARRYGNLNKGAEANEIISMNGSFHGRTLGALTATGQPKMHDSFGPLLPNVKYAEFNDIDSVKNLISEKTAAIILEPIKGEGGIVPADPEFLKEIRKLCDETNTLLIFDEVQCGASRAGEFLASQLYGVKPDIITMAKGIGAGFPVGACITTKEVGDYLSPGTHGSTYGGNPLACKVVAFVVDKITQPEFLKQVQENGNYFKKKLKELQIKYNEAITDVRGEGLILGIQFKEEIPVAEIVSKALEKGLLIVSAAQNSIRFVPPLIISKDEIDKGIEILEESIQEIV